LASALAAAVESLGSFWGKIGAKNRDSAWVGANGLKQEPFNKTASMAIETAIIIEIRC